MDSSESRTLERDPAFSLQQAAIDRRRHRRIAVTLLGRFMRANKKEFPCKLVDISETGAAINTLVEVDMGERIVAYFDHIGGIEGTVVRVYNGGFAIELIATPYKREKLAAQIAWLINRHEIGGSVEARRHQRHALANKSTTLKLDEGISVDVQVANFSMSGAAVTTEARPPIGSEVMLGKLRGRVVRHQDDGIGIEFLDLQNTEAVRRYFGSVER